MAYLNNDDFATILNAIGELARNRQHLDLHADDQAMLDNAWELMTNANAAVASPGLRDLADELYGDDECEIDDEGAGTSSSDDGTWVQAWVWVSKEDMIEHGLIEDDDEDKCATPDCDGAMDDGEGFDGYCGNCADRRQAALDAGEEVENDEGNG